MCAGDTDGVSGSSSGERSEAPFFRRKTITIGELGSSSDVASLGQKDTPAVL